MDTPTQPDASWRPTGASSPSTGHPDAALEAALRDPSRRLGRYVIVTPIGRGGMGEVFRAHDAALRRDVAIKLIHQGADRSPRARERFLREARAAARLRHPGIVRVHEVGEHAGRPYLVMDLVPGESLADLRSRGPIPPRRVAELVRDIARALDHAHAGGVVHRDVKPDNVLIDREGKPYLTDFGVARDVQTSRDITTTGQIVGTPVYASPEQLRGHIRDVGPRSDVYSLGALLYDALAGTPPFDADTVATLLYEALNTDPVALRTRDPSIPAELETIAEACLRKIPGDRYPSAAAVADDLGRFLAGEPILARPEGTLRRFARVAARNRTAVAGAVALVAGLGALAGAVALVALARPGGDDADTPSRTVPPRAVSSASGPPPAPTPRPSGASTPNAPEDWPDYPQSPFVIPLDRDIPGQANGGGIFVHDLTGDGRLDYVITSRFRVSAHDHDGPRLWEHDGGLPPAAHSIFPGTHYTGAVAADLDGDGRPEVGWLTEHDEIVIVDGATGREERRLPAGGARAVMLANLRGEGDRDLVLQEGPRRIHAIRADTGAELWRRDDFAGADCPSMAVDLDDDGRDEVVGSVILDAEGREIGGDAEIGTASALVVADLIAGGPLEILLAQKFHSLGTVALDPTGVRWSVTNRDDRCGQLTGKADQLAPTYLAVGNFQGSRDRLEVFARSTCGRAPWVIDAAGEIIARWSVDDTSPDGWTEAGIEEVSAIDWDGDGTRKLLAKERHRAGDVAVIDAVTGRFVRVFPGRATRVYAADVAGDAREEIITLDAEGTIKIWRNETAALDPSRPRHWERQVYRRSKQSRSYRTP